MRVCTVWRRDSHLIGCEISAHVVCICANCCLTTGACTHSNVNDGRGWYFADGCPNGATGTRDMYFYVRQYAGTAYMNA